MTKNICSLLYQSRTTSSKVSPGPSLLRTIEELELFYDNVLDHDDVLDDQLKRQFFQEEDNVVLAMVGVQRRNPCNYQIVIVSAQTQLVDPSMIEIWLKDERAENLGGSFTLKSGSPYALFTLPVQIEAVSVQYNRRGDNFVGFGIEYLSIMSDHG